MFVLCENLKMHFSWFNRSQRVVVVIGFGVALYILGAWLSAPEFPVNAGWTGYAPLISSYGRARVVGRADLILWLVLTAIWVAASSYLLRTGPSNRDHN